MPSSSVTFSTPFEDVEKHPLVHLTVANGDELLNLTHPPAEPIRQVTKVGGPENLQSLNTLPRFKADRQLVAPKKLDPFRRNCGIVLRAPFEVVVWMMSPNGGIASKMALGAYFFIAGALWAWWLRGSLEM
ncbi:hypothetical protein BDN72DRAFT_193080 [Pluteus cervinus]|uniref:Uncharacterized protein n=1 Tax=Pluteus cervinus TaxID=181527 RepID=A0ACD3AIT5_9AGAR|nr:hypothetical protein BDN72DRAFT_193080 [Pluteus cervinus]